MSDEAESLVRSLEAAFHRVDTVERSSVRLTAAEVELQECIQQVRALLSEVLRDSSDRARLVHLFGGDCFRIARIRAVLDSAKAAAYSQIDMQDELDMPNQPVHSTCVAMCLEECASIEEVLRDLGHDEALSNAKEKRRRVSERRSSDHGAPLEMEQETSGTTALQGLSMLREPNEAIVEQLEDGVHRLEVAACAVIGCNFSVSGTSLSKERLHAETGVIGCSTTNSDFCVQKANSSTAAACEAFECKCNFNVSSTLLPKDGMHAVSGATGCTTTDNDFRVQKGYSNTEDACEAIVCKCNFGMSGTAVPETGATGCTTTNADFTVQKANTAEDAGEVMVCRHNFSVSSTPRPEDGTHAVSGATGCTTTDTGFRVQKANSNTEDACEAVVCKCNFGMSGTALPETGATGCTTTDADFTVQKANTTEDAGEVMVCKRSFSLSVTPFSDDGMHADSGMIGCATTDAHFFVQKANSTTEDACEAITCKDVEERKMLTECRHSLESNFPGGTSQTCSSIADSDCSYDLSYQTPVGPLAGIMEDGNTLLEGGCGIDSASQALADTEAGDMSVECVFDLQRADRAAQALSMSRTVCRGTSTCCANCLEGAPLSDKVVAEVTGGRLADAHGKGDSACPVGDELTGKPEHDGAVSVRCNFGLQTSRKDAEGAGGHRVASILLGMAPRASASVLPLKPITPPVARPLKPLAKRRVSNVVAVEVPGTGPTAQRTRAETAPVAINHMMPQLQPQMPRAWSNSFQTPTSSCRQCMPAGLTRMLSSNSVGGVKPVPSSNGSSCSTSRSSSSESSARELQILTASPQSIPWSPQSLPRLKQVGLVAEPFAQPPCQRQTQTLLTLANNPWGSPVLPRRSVNGPTRAYQLEGVMKRHSMLLPTEPIATPMALRMAR